MTRNSNPEHGGNRLGTWDNKNFQNDTSRGGSCQYFKHGRVVKRWIRACIGLLFYKNMIGFCTACKIARMMGVESD